MTVSNRTFGLYASARDCTTSTLSSSRVSRTHSRNRHFLPTDSTSTKCTPGSDDRERNARESRRRCRCPRRAAAQPRHHRQAVEDVLGDLRRPLTDGREVHARVPVVEQVEVLDQLRALRLVEFDAEAAGAVEEGGHAARIPCAPQHESQLRTSSDTNSWTGMAMTGASTACSLLARVGGKCPATALSSSRSTCTPSRTSSGWRHSASVARGVPPSPTPGQAQRCARQADPPAPARPVAHPG